MKQSSLIIVAIVAIVAIAGLYLYSGETEVEEVDTTNEIPEEEEEGEIQEPVWTVCLDETKVWDGMLNGETQTETITSSNCDDGTVRVVFERWFECEPGSTPAGTVSWTIRDSAGNRIFTVNDIQEVCTWESQGGTPTTIDGAFWDAETGFTVVVENRVGCTINQDWRIRVYHLV